MAALLLPDLSEFQAGADMAGIRRQNGGAAIIRAAYGARHPDRAFARLRAAAHDYAYLGIYHYIVAAQSIADQARVFCKLVGQLAPHEIPFIDLEEGAGNQSDRANAWLLFVDQRLGLSRRPLENRSGLYSGESFAQSAGLAPVFDSKRRTWVAAYRASEPVMPHTLWQSTNGLVGANITSWPGAGRCDTNLYHGTLAQLAATIRPGASPVKHTHPEESMPIQLARGAAAKTPLALHEGARSVRFFASEPATVHVDLRDGKQPRELKLAYHAAAVVEVPHSVHAIVVHRIDDGANDVSAAVS